MKTDMARQLSVSAHAARLLPPTKTGKCRSPALVHFIRGSFFAKFAAHTRSIRCGIACGLLLLATDAVRADSTTGEISEAEVIAYAKNIWGWSEFSDNAIIVALDGSYAGFPFRDYVKALIVGWDFQNLYGKGKLKEAGGVLAKYAAKQVVNRGLKGIGMSGVVPIANLAAWPVEWGINRFEVAVEASAHELHLRYYFAARAHNSYAAIVSAAPGELIEADVTGGFLTKSDQGWLYRSGGFVNSVPGMTPADLFNEAEHHWLLAEAKAALENDNVTLREAFGRVIAPSGPVIATDLVDQTITEGQAATFMVSATGNEPLTYTWFFNGVQDVGSDGPSWTVSDPGQYQVRVRDSLGRVAQSRIAVLTVNPAAAPVVLTAPAAGANLSGTITVRASAPEAGKVEFWLDGERRFTDSSAPFTWA